MNIITFPVFWIGFFLIIGIGLIIDFLLFNKYLYKYNIFQKSFVISVVWLFISLGFSLFLWIYVRYCFNSMTANRQIIFFIFSYFIEQSLSIDNVLTWLLLFKYFSIPIHLQRRVLRYGLIGAVILRIMVIFCGYYFFLYWYWIMFLFGLILFFSAIDMIMPDKNSHVGFKDNIIFKYFQRHFRITNKLYKEKFFVCHNKKWYITPLLITLVMVELSDILFSIDSIPAVFSVNQDLLIIFTSNIFAVLGLRSIYFLMLNIINRFSYLQNILAFILIILSIKMLFGSFIYVLKSFFAIFLTIFLIIFLIYNFILKYILK